MLPDSQIAGHKKEVMRMGNSEESWTIWQQSTYIGNGKAELQTCENTSAHYTKRG